MEVEKCGSRSGRKRGASMLRNEQNRVLGSGAREEWREGAEVIMSFVQMYGYKLGFCQ